MQVLILQYDDRGDVYPDLSIKNREYAERMRYDYHFATTSPYDIPCYWQKIFLVRDMLEEYDAVLWVDTDAVIHANTPIPYLDSTKDIVFCTDAPVWKNMSLINTGVFLARGTEMGKYIMDEWKKGYVPERWYKESGKWKCDGEWAGIDYEQGYYASIAHRFIRWTKVPNSKVFQTIRVNEISDETFTLHFPTVFKSGIMDYISSFIKT